jgi:GntR family carbon starvation induced transcriptional regulator
MSAAKDTPERMTATDRLQRRLEEDILSGRLRPGMWLKPATLAPEYGVSVTPFREVLARLQSRGLVETDPFVGARVAGMSAAEARDLFAVRRRLETEALVLTLRAADAAWEAHVRDVLARLDAASSSVDGADTSELALRWLRVHREFHWALVSACASPWTLRLLRDLYDHLDRYQAMAWTENGLRPRSLGEHHALARAALARDERDAVEALEAHIESAVSWIVDAVEAAAAQEVQP